MANQPVTREKLIQADVDVENLGKAVNEKGVVNPRYGGAYPTLPSAIQMIIETGGFEPFTTEAELKATTPILPKKASYSLDTHKIWLWNRTSGEGVTPVTGTWIDTGLSAKDQAIAYLDKVLDDPYDLLEYTTLTSGGVSPSGGSVISSVWSKTDFVPVKYGDKVSYNVYGGTTVAFAAAYNSDKVFLRDLSPYSTLSVQQKIGELEIVDSDVAFVRFSFRVDGSYTHSITKKDLTIKTESLDLASLTSEVWSGINGNINLFDINQAVDGQYLINNVGQLLSTWFTSGYIPVEPGKYYTTNGTAGGSTAGVGIHFYDSTKAFLNVGAKQAANTPFLIPSGVSFIRLSYAKSLSSQISETWVVSGIEYKEDILAEKIQAVIDENPAVSENRYNGKTLMTLGDSITDSTSTSFTYPPIVANYFGMTLFDGGWSGRRIRNAFGRATIASDANILSSHIITIAHGTNDFKLETSLGAIDDSPTPKATLDNATYNATTNQTDGTFYADYKGVIEHILTINPQARIMLITPIRRTQAAGTGTDTNAKGHKLIDYVNAIKTIAEYYGLAVLDNYNTSGFNAKTIPVWTSDGLHPTEWAQRNVMAQKVIGFIESN